MNQFSRNLKTLKPLPFSTTKLREEALAKPKKEMALPINGRRSKLGKKDMVDYFAINRLGLNANIIDEILMRISSCLPRWKELITESLLSDSIKEKYINILFERCSMLGL